MCNMVPINEMPEVLRVKTEQTEIMVKQWVRVKRGIYKGDIGQIDRVDPSQKQIRLKLLPRIDYTKRCNASLKTAPYLIH